MEIQKMFQGKNVSTLDGKAIINVKTVIVEVNVVGVNVATRSRIIESKCSKNENQGKTNLLQIGGKKS